METSAVLFKTVPNYEQYGYSYIGDFKIIIRKSDNFVNASHLLREYTSKKFFHWNELKSSKEFIAAVQDEYDSSKNKPVLDVQKNLPIEIRGTYVHMDIAWDVAMWGSTVHKLKCIRVLQGIQNKLNTWQLEQQMKKQQALAEHEHRRAENAIETQSKLKALNKHLEESYDGALELELRAEQDWAKLYEELKEQSESSADNELNITSLARVKEELLEALDTHGFTDEIKRAEAVAAINERAVALFRKGKYYWKLKNIGRKAKHIKCYLASGHIENAKRLADQLVERSRVEDDDL